MIYAVGIAVVLFVVVLVGCQNRLVFHPTKTLETTPLKALGLAFEDVSIPCSDKVTIHGWYIPAKGATQTVLLFHGNAGNISHRTETIRVFHDLGRNVLIVDYHGYGKSGGSVGEAATYRDADAAWDYLAVTKKCKPSEIVIFGRSLGGAVGVYLATKHADAAGMIVESTFTSTGDMAAEMFPWLPGLRYLLTIDYPSLKRIASVKCPLLVVHSAEDDMIPYKMGQKLFKAANEPKTFLKISGPHNGGYYQSLKIYKPAMKTFLNGLKNKPAGNK